MTPPSLSGRLGGAFAIPAVVDQFSNPSVRPSPASLSGWRRT
jgi:hypothetical protein